jgi:UDP-N-acetylglucosamine--N-acetylmuramyl-(pentapeptide) pyrophosphoryl-undecaprenol N-acetylglucosamine transferase
LTKGSIMMTGGGTGGHLFPALALSEELARRGYETDLITDSRTEGLGANFPVRAIYRAPSATFRSRSPLEATRTLATLSQGFQIAYKLMGEVKPRAIVGFGGYPTVPPILAALARRVPAAIHEANAVMGRANRLLAPMVKSVACSFEQTRHLEGKLLAKTRLTGSPLRKSVLSQRGKAYEPHAPGKKFVMLVFGGSQGARFFSESMPAALALLSEQIRDKMLVVQQCRAEDIDAVFEAYEEAGVAAELATFFDDLPERMSAAHLVVARSGAGAVAELCAVGRPAVLIPLPHAIDNDQMENAQRFERGGGGWTYEQSVMTPERMAGVVRRLYEEPATLQKAASRAISMAHYDAVEKLADMVEQLAAGAQPKQAPEQAPEGEKS